MKLHELTAGPGFHQRGEDGLAEATAPDAAKPLARATRVRRPEPDSGMRPGFEGGQMPLQRRLPKRGFNNIFATKHRRSERRFALKKFENGAVVDVAGASSTQVSSKRPETA